MAPEFYVFTIAAPLLTILIVFGLRYLAQVQQAKARWGNDEAYRQLAEKAAADQATAAAALTAIEARLAAVEKVLKEVG